jgi:hypothetical protein
MQIGLLHTLNSKLHDSEDWLRTKFYDKRDVFNFPIVTFPFYKYVATCQQHMHIAFISLS